MKTQDQEKRLRPWASAELTAKIRARGLTVRQVWDLAEEAGWDVEIASALLDRRDPSFETYLIQAVRGSVVTLPIEVFA